jgi:carbonic anhydrase
MKAVGVGLMGIVVGLFCVGSGYAKPGADEALAMLKAGNERFAAGKLTHPRDDKARVELAAKSNQGDFALATLISCSDSRVPPEYIFDTGIMDLFIVRIAGNVCDTDEIGSAEYGVLHVKTPVLVVMGHSQCGAVTAVAKSKKGEGHALERNIPPLVDNIIAPVEKVIAAFPQASMENLIVRATEENVWAGIEAIFLKSPALRKAAKDKKVAVVGAIYNLETGLVKWLPRERVEETLAKVEKDPARIDEDPTLGAASHAEGHGGEKAPVQKSEPAAEPSVKSESPAAHGEKETTPAQTHGGESAQH